MCGSTKDPSDVGASVDLIEPIILYIPKIYGIMEPMAQENEMVAVVKMIVAPENVLDRVEHLWTRFYEVRISGRGRIRKKRIPFKDGKALIKAWDRRPEEEAI